MKTSLVLAIALSAASLSSAVAQTVIFSGTDGTLDLDAPSGSFTKGGLKATLAANDGNVNATSSGLGINDSATGDDTDGLDTINLVEFLTLSFDKAITFDSITLADVGINDALSVSIAGGAPVTITSSGKFVFSDPKTVLTGQFVTLTAAERNSPTPNNGINVTQFTVTVIPEPTSLLLLLSGSAFIALRRRKRLRK